VQGGYGAVFGMVVQIFWPIRVSRYKFDRSYEFITGYKVGGGHWCSVAVQVRPEPEIYQGIETVGRAQERITAY